MYKYNIENSLRCGKCCCVNDINNASLLSLSLTDVSIETNSIKEDITNTRNDNVNKTIIHVSDDTLKEAFFFPKKLTNMYNYIYKQFQYQYHLYNTIAHSLHYNCNIYCNHNNSNPSCSYLCNNNSSFTNTSSTTISSVTNYDTSFSINNTNNKLVNKDNTSSPVAHSDKDKENTAVLCVSLKISAKENLVFKIRRYDDMFKTVQMFCEINNLETSFIRPLIIYVIKTMNMIYGVMNMKLTEDDISYLHMIKTEHANQSDLNDI